MSFTSHSLAPFLAQELDRTKEQITALLAENARLRAALEDAKQDIMQAMRMLDRVMEGKGK